MKASVLFLSAYFNMSLRKLMSFHVNYGHKHCDTYTTKNFFRRRRWTYFEWMVLLIFLINFYLYMILLSNNANDDPTYTQRMTYLLISCQFWGICQICRPGTFFWLRWKSDIELLEDKHNSSCFVQCVWKNLCSFHRKIFHNGSRIFYPHRQGTDCNT